MRHSGGCNTAKSFLQATALLLSCLFLAVCAQQGISSRMEPQLNKPRFEYKYSFRPPFYMARSAAIPFWDFGGSAMINEEFIRLTPPTPSRQGWIWNKRPSTMDEWEVVLRFRIHGEDYTGADGMAFWYTKESLQTGNTFGNQDKFTGLGIFFDTFDNDGKGDFPAIVAMLNDGTKTFSFHNDGADQSIGRCLASLRNSKHPLKTRVKYQSKTLTVDLSYEDPETLWRPCISARIENLPSGFYFGVSAATGGHSDHHDIYSVQTTDLSPVSYEEVYQSQAPVADATKLPAENVNNLSPKDEGIPKISDPLPPPRQQDLEPASSALEIPPPAKRAPQETESLVTTQAQVSCPAKDLETLQTDLESKFKEINELLKNQISESEKNQADAAKEVEKIRKQNEVISKAFQKQAESISQLSTTLEKLQELLDGHKDHVVGALSEQERNDETMKSSLKDLSNMVVQLRDIVSASNMKHEALVRDVANNLRESVYSGSSSIQWSLVAIFAILLGVLVYAWKNKSSVFSSMA